MAIRKTRKFGGKAYLSTRYTPKKRVAEKWAKASRDLGRPARITKQMHLWKGGIAPVFIVWIRK